MPTLIGKKAPAFRTKAVIDGGKIVDNFSLDQFIDKKICCTIFLY
jgi:peroxiredoxin (alkyl hydroperoxide reductase subunit C)